MMQTISFTNAAARDVGVQLIMFSGPVEFTGRRWVYRVPSYTVELLKEKKVPFKFIKPINDHR